MDLLARREHSRLELTQKLASRSSSLDELNLVLDELQADNLLCDERFCEFYIRSRYLRGQGPRRIEVDLRQRGIKDALIAEYLTRSDLDWVDSLRQLIEKKYGPAPSTDIHSKAKQQRFLQSRGFTFEQIQVAFEGLRDELMAN